MAIKNIVTSLAGETGVIPRLIRISTTDSFDTVTTANYLQSAIAMGYTFYPNDMCLISHGSNSEITQFFTITISGENITLNPLPGIIDLPVTAQYIAVFDGTTGRLASGAETAINPGNIHAGLSGTEGHLVSYPATASTGNFEIRGVSNAGNYTIVLANASHGQATTYSINDVGQSTGWIMNCKNSTDPGANLISFDVTVGQAALASGGSVTLVDSSGSKQYKVRSLQLNAIGTNFSGGGGNRLGQVTDNTTVYSIIPSATMQSLSNAQWGATALPNPSGFSINQSTAAGADLVFKYSGGTTDYTAGSLVISGIVERVA